MPLLCLLCAGALRADFEGTVKFTVTGAGNLPLEGVKVTAASDPWWGRGSQETFDQFNKLHGPLPTVEASGEFTTDKTGVVELKVSVKVSAEGKLPQHSVMLGGKWVNSNFVIVRLTLSKEGYRTLLSNESVSEAGTDESRKSGVTMRKLTSYQAKLVHLSDRSPASKLLVQVEGRRNYSMDSKANQPLEILTDAEGVLTLGDEQVPLQYMKLRVLDDKLAFAPNSAAWNSITIKEGANDGGTLVVVPGGSIRVRSVHAESGAALDAQISVFGTDPNARFEVRQDSISGECLLKGIPAGSHRLVAHVSTSSTLWPSEIDPVLVEAGQVTDLGEVKIEPHLSLEVFAIGSEGGGILQYSVSAEQLSGFRPFTENQGRAGQGPRPWIVYRSCTPERCKVDRLARGRWRVQVTAEGYSPGSIEVDLPISEPLQLKLEQGGQLHATPDKDAFGDSYFDAIIAIASTAPAQKSLAGRSGAEVLSMIRTVDSTGVYISDRHNDNRGLGALAPGTYTVFGYFKYGTSLRADNVQIRKGEITKLTLTASSASVTVRVTKQGKPLAQEVVYIVPAHDWEQSPAEKPSSGRTDGQGVVVFNGVKAGTYRLLTSRQNEWSGAGMRHKSLPEGMGTQLKLGYGDRVETLLEADPAGYVWVRVKLKLAKGVTVSDVVLTNLFGQLGTSTTVGTATGDTYDFGPQPQGESYELRATVSPSRNLDGQFKRFLHVTEPGDQLFEFAVGLGKVEVKVKAPKGVKNQQVWVVLEHPHELAWATYGYPVFNGYADAKGSITFDNVPEGPYRVVAGASPDNFEDRRGVRYLTSEDFELKGTKKLSLTFDEDTGTLELKFADFKFVIEPLPVIVELRDGDAPAKLGVPNTVFRQADGLSIAGIAKGTYTLHVSAPGYEPFVQEDVGIETGRTTRLDIKLVKMFAVSLQLEGASVNAPQLRAASIQFLDAAGAVIDLGRIDVRRTVEVRTEENASVLDLKHVPLHCATVRIAVSGFKTLNVDVKPQRATRHSTKATLERE